MTDQSTSSSFPASPSSTNDSTSKASTSTTIDSTSTTNTIISSVQSKIASWMDDDGEGYLSRVVISPLLFISFIFSLMIVDRQTKKQTLSVLSTEQQPLLPNSSQRPRSSDGSGGGGEYEIVTGRRVKSELSNAFSLQNRILVLIGCVIMSGFVMVWYVMSKMRQMLAI